PLCGNYFRGFASGKTPRLDHIHPEVGVGICFWRGGATAGGHRPRKRRNPRKARFSAQPKMRPDEILKKPLLSVNSMQVEAL
ncbi:MAG: hypothetical protein LBK61_01315, partial [Spirochaetaceae bacterium]|nr:hypothetical protein [Spirochaetaceae bacterium]